MYETLSEGILLANKLIDLFIQIKPFLKPKQNGTITILKDLIEKFFKKNQETTMGVNKFEVLERNQKGKREFLEFYKNYQDYIHIHDLYNNPEILLH